MTPRGYIIAQWIIAEFEGDLTDDLADGCMRVLATLALSSAGGNAAEASDALRKLIGELAGHVAAIGDPPPGQAAAS